MLRGSQARGTERESAVEPTRPAATHPLRNFLPTWGPEPLAYFPGSDPALWDPYRKAFPGAASSSSGGTAVQGAEPQHGTNRNRIRTAGALRGERGCFSMARVFSILSALAAIFLVAGASAKY